MLYYQLSNGEYIEIRQNKWNEVQILLFNGSTELNYKVGINDYTLNQIIKEIEKDYGKLKQEDLKFQMYANYY